jgi:PAS domain-containing protein
LDEKAIRELRESGVCTPYEKEYVRRNGTRVPVFLADAILPGPDEQILAFALDVTERKRAEENLRKSEERFRSTLDNMLEGCQIIGHDWMYRYLNKAISDHSRRPEEELIGKRFMDVWPGIEDTEVFGIIKHCMEEKVSHHMEMNLSFRMGRRLVRPQHSTGT